MQEQIEEIVEDLQPLKPRDIAGIRLIPRIIKSVNYLLKRDPQNGAPGKDGMTPVKGVHYFTKREVQHFKKAVTPVKGVHYRDGIDGKNGDKGEKGADGIDAPSIDEIVPEVLKNIPKPKDGVSPDKNEIIKEVKKLIPKPKDGKDADHESIINEVVKKIPKPKDGKNGKAPTELEIRKLIRPFTKKHEEKHDHSLLHKSTVLGEYEIGEVKDGETLIIQGKKIVGAEQKKVTNIYKTGGGGASSWNQLRGGIKTVTADYTATTDDFTVLCDATSGAITITLPEAAQNDGRVYNIKKTDSSTNTVTIDGNGSETIDDDTTAVITSQYECITIQCNGSNWFII